MLLEHVDEMNKEAGTLVVDRFLYTSMSYPGNYGFVPHTLSEDGDPIDVLNALGANVRIIAPSTLMPSASDRLGVETFTDMWAGVTGADVVMMLRLQRERMAGAFVPSEREYFHYFGLDQDKLSYAKPDALIMHPGPMNRGVEIASTVADHSRSVIQEQVEMGVAIRMACLDVLTRRRRAVEGWA